MRGCGILSGQKPGGTTDGAPPDRIDLAQRIEQKPYKLCVAGSNPAVNRQKERRRQRYVKKWLNALRPSGRTEWELDSQGLEPSIASRTVG